MNPRFWTIVAAVLGGSGVALGAFAAHSLPDFLTGAGVAQEEVTSRLETFETAVRYQMYHALALLGLVALCGRAHPGWARASAACYLAGTLIFSGCLYALVISGVKVLGAVVPIGGVLLIAGWTALIVAAVRGPRS